jgi:hypothetical protein
LASEQAGVGGALAVRRREGDQRAGAFAHRRQPAGSRPSEAKRVVAAGIQDDNV